MNDYQAWNQTGTVDRIHSTLARSSVGPALLWTIQNKNKQTTQVLKDMKDLDERLNNPQRFEEIRKEKYYEYKHQKLSQLTTQSDTYRSSRLGEAEPHLPHEAIF